MVKGAAYLLVFSIQIIGYIGGDCWGFFCFFCCYKGKHFIPSWKIGAAQSSYFKKFTH